MGGSGELYPVFFGIFGSFFTFAKPLNRHVFLWSHNDTNKHVSLQTDLNTGFDTQQYSLALNTHAQLQSDLKRQVMTFNNTA